MIERLPTPWGLVRLGVAPDHPEHQGRLAGLREDREAARLPLSRQRRGRARSRRTPTSLALYDAVVYAVGAQTDRRLGIPGEDLPGSWAGDGVRRLVQRPPGLPGPRLRPLLRAGGRDRQRQRRRRRRSHARARRGGDRSDRHDGRGDRRRSSARRIEEIVMLGRRGPAQASFTTPELKELGELADADIVVDPAELELDPASEAALSRPPSRATSRCCASTRRARPSGKRRPLRLRFCVSPVAILGDGRVEAVEIVRNVLVADDRGRVAPWPTDEREVIPCGVVFRSVGYRGIPVPGCPVRRGARDDAQRAAGGCSTRTAGRCRASTAPAGSSAGRPGSSERTRRTPPRPSTLCSRMLAAGVLGRATRATAEDVDAFLAERGVERRRVRRLGGDRRARVRDRASRTGDRGSSSSAGTSCSRPRSSACPDALAGRLGLMARDATQRELWGAETRKAVANFPVSGEPIPVAGRPLARPDQGRGRARQRRARAARRRHGGAHRRSRRPGRRRRVRRPVPDRRLPDRLGHVLEHERERGHRRAGRARASTRTIT